MRNADDTATTHEELAEQFPPTNRPFAVWHNSAPEVDNNKWVVNGEDGEACADFADLAKALKAAAEMGAEWDAEAKRQAQTLAKVFGRNKLHAKDLAATEFANETWRDMGAGYFNPLIGYDSAETFSNISAVLGFVHDVMEDHPAGETLENVEGMRLLLQTAWTAAQYSGNLQSAINEVAEVKHA